MTFRHRLLVAAFVGGLIWAAAVHGWSVVLSPRPGWRPASPDETPGELTPEA